MGFAPWFFLAFHHYLQTRSLLATLAVSGCPDNTGGPGWAFGQKGVLIPISVYEVWHVDQ